MPVDVGDGADVPPAFAVCVARVLVIVAVAHAGEKPPPDVPALAAAEFADDVLDAAAPTPCGVPDVAVPKFGMPLAEVPVPIAVVPVRVPLADGALVPVPTPVVPAIAVPALLAADAAPGDPLFVAAVPVPLTAVRPDAAPVETPAVLVLSLLLVPPHTTSSGTSTIAVITRSCPFLADFVALSSTPPCVSPVAVAATMRHVCRALASDEWRMAGIIAIPAMRKATRHTEALCA